MLRDPSAARSAVPPAARVRAATDAAVQFERVTKSFEDRNAVQDLELVVPRGAVYGLLGPNGAGKTTSIRMLMGILLPDTGSVGVLGGRNAADVKDRIGYLPEERGLYVSMRVLDNLVFFGSLRGLSRAEARRRGALWLEKLGLADVADRKLQELSKGNQQKVGFAATVLHEPELVVLDEPFSGLDPVNQDLLRRSIFDLSASGTTIILSTHLMDEVERVCTHLTLLESGRTLTSGTLEDVKRRWGGETLVLEISGDAAVVERHPWIVAAQRVGRTIEATIAPGRDPSDLLADLVSKCRVRRFEVRTASLHSIFVRLVSEARADVARAERPTPAIVAGAERAR